MTTSFVHLIAGTMPILRAFSHNIRFCSQFLSNTVVSPGVTAFLMGLGLGAVAAAVGGLLSYWFGLRHRDDRTAVPVFYLFLFLLLLGVIGVFALIFGAFSGALIQGIISGLGVAVGFSVVFGTLLFAYTRVDNED